MTIDTLLVGGAIAVFDAGWGRLGDTTLRLANLVVGTIAVGPACSRGKVFAGPVVAVLPCAAIAVALAFGKWSRLARTVLADLAGGTIAVHSAFRANDASTAAANGTAVAVGIASTFPCG